MTKVYVCKPGKKDGRNWVLVVKDAGRVRRYSSGTPNKAEARRAAKEMEAAANATVLSGPAETVGQVFRGYLAHVRSTLEPLTAVSTETCLKRLAELEPIGLSDLTRRHVAAARDALKSRLDGKTVNLTLGKGRLAFSWAREAELTEASWPEVQPVKGKPTKKEPYTADEVRKILAWAESFAGGRYRLVLAVILETGARAEEICRLRGRDLNRSESLVYLGKTKTDDPRWSGVRPKTMAMLPEVEDEAWVFPAARRKGPMGSEPVRHALTKAREALGIAGCLDLHSLRRTHSCEAETGGVDERLVMKQQGHQSLPQHRAYKRRARGDNLLVPAQVVGDRCDPLTEQAESLTGIGSQPLARQEVYRSRSHQSDEVSGEARPGLPAETPYRTSPPSGKGLPQVPADSVRGADPFSARISALVSADPEALAALVTSAVRLRVLQEVLTESGHIETTGAQRSKEHGT